jgi:hypothetical protein
MKLFTDRDPLSPAQKLSRRRSNLIAIVAVIAFFALFYLTGNTL